MGWTSIFAAHKIYERAHADDEHDVYTGLLLSMTNIPHGYEIYIRWIILRHFNPIILLIYMTNVTHCISQVYIKFELLSHATQAREGWVSEYKKLKQFRKLNFIVEYAFFLFFRMCFPARVRLTLSHWRESLLTKLQKSSFVLLNLCGTKTFPLVKLMLRDGDINLYSISSSLI